MELIKIDSQRQLDQFVISQSDQYGSEFAQSWIWGEREAAAGKNIVRWGVSRADRLLAVMTAIKKELPGGLFYWYAPRGPLGDPAAIKFLLSELKKTAGGMFLRCEPRLNTIDYLSSVGDGRFKLVKTIDWQPKQSWVLDLDSSEADILGGMHQKTRYNIRLAEKKGVEIKESADFEEFWRLINLTGERDSFRLHGREHYRRLLEGNSAMKLYLAVYQGKNIAAGIFSFWGDKATYLHGASDNELRNLMAPYLLQWEMIKKAKKDAYKYYDFYGIDEKKWPGVTRFKLGFGGRRVAYPGTFDVVFCPIFYFIYNQLRRVRRLIK
jgi:lipid II:glycine glycyltransferase (peptidoglycan interpeptide bridge formation enzyme)